MIGDWFRWLFLHGDGYQFWSGVGSGSPLFVIMGAWWHHHNCHVRGCYRIGHIDPDVHHPACRHHHSRLGGSNGNDT